MHFVRASSQASANGIADGCVSRAVMGVWAGARGGVSDLVRGAILIRHTPSYDPRPERGCVGFGARRRRKGAKLALESDSPTGVCRTTRAGRGLFATPPPNVGPGLDAGTPTDSHPRRCRQTTRSRHRRGARRRCRRRPLTVARPCRGARRHGVCRIPRADRELLDTPRSASAGTGETASGPNEPTPSVLPFNDALTQSRQREAHIATRLTPKRADARRTAGGWLPAGGAQDGQDRNGTARLPAAPAVRRPAVRAAAGRAAGSSRARG